MLLLNCSNKKKRVHDFISFSGGNIGLVTSIFSSRAAPGRRIQKPWTKPMSYPAIKGLSIYKNMTFSNFGTYCGSSKRDVIVMTSKDYGDILHPVRFHDITLHNVQHDSKVTSPSHMYLIPVNFGA